MAEWVGEVGMYKTWRKVRNIPKAFYQVLSGSMAIFHFRSIFSHSTFPMQIIVTIHSRSVDVCPGLRSPFNRKVSYLFIYFNLLIISNKWENVRSRKIHPLVSKDIAFFPLGCDFLGRFWWFCLSKGVRIETIEGLEPFSRLKLGFFYSSLSLFFPISRTGFPSL